MNSTFFRSVIGFSILTASLILMAIGALWSIEVYAGDYPWVSILVILVGLVAQVGVYFSTLHEPLYGWIGEPEDLTHKFMRSVTGFLILTAALVMMTATVLWSIESYAGEYLWASVVVVMVALVTQIIVYLSTLHPPVSEWITAPQRERERLEAANSPPPAPSKKLYS